MTGNEKVTPYTQNELEVQALLIARLTSRLRSQGLAASADAIERLLATARLALESQSPVAASAGDVTAAEIEAVALQYDKEYRGGIGRGDIDTELAERLAAWFNARRPPASTPPRLRSADSARLDWLSENGSSVRYDFIEGSDWWTVHRHTEDRKLAGEAAGLRNAIDAARSASDAPKDQSPKMGAPEPQEGR